MNNLPSSFTSLYRLFLRASSASVLHENLARKQIRRLFRPLFDAAAQVVGELQGNQLSHLERIKRQLFLDAFQQQTDGTLSFLLNSAQYRGVPHRVIYNINRLRITHTFWIQRKYYTDSKGVWNPKTAGANNPKARVSHRRREIDRMERNRMHEHCWDALEEVVRMAEGRHKLSFGRLHLEPWTLEK